jgi:iron-sulfur cluster insertion protein
MSGSSPVPISFGEQKAVPQAFDFNHGKPVDLTSSAVKKVRDFLASTPAAAGKHFRIYVEGGGCSGFQYGFTFDNAKPDDQIVPCQDIEVLVDPNSINYLKSSVVDYTEDFRGSGFVVHNPQAKASCGCGISFAV